MLFPAAFYPGVAGGQKAGIVEIGRGTEIEGLIIKIPFRLAEKTISGSVSRADGTPAVDALVNLEDTRTGTVCVNGCTKTDSNGVFILRGLTGRTYQISGRGDKTINGAEQTFTAATVPFVLNEKTTTFKLVLESKPGKSDNR